MSKTIRIAALLVVMIGLVGCTTGRVSPPMAPRLMAGEQESRGALDTIRSIVDETTDEEASEDEIPGDAPQKDARSEPETDPEPTVEEQVPSGDSPEPAALEIVNATDQVLAKITVRPSGGDEIHFRETVDAGDATTLTVPAGRAEIDLVFAVGQPGSRRLRLVSIESFPVVPEGASLSVDSAGWDDLPSPEVSLPVTRPYCAWYYDDDGDGEWDRIERQVFRRRTTIGYEYDDNADGEIDRAEEIIRDGAGRNAGVRRDTDGDGEWDYIERRQYDGPVQTGTTIDEDGDGEIDEVVTRTTDEATGASVTETDTGNDGEPDRVEYRYPREGTISVFEIDEDGDGRIDVREEQVYPDEDSFLVAVTRTDADADGEWDTVIRYEYNDQNYQTRAETDSDGDGSPDEIVTNVYENSRLAEVRRDTDADGTADETEWYEYDGRYIVATHIDRDQDGEPEYTRRSSYDIVGNLTRIEVDSDGDGEPDEVERLSRACWDDYDETGPVF